MFSFTENPVFIPMENPMFIHSLIIIENPIFFSGEGEPYIFRAHEWLP